MSTDAEYAGVVEAVTAAVERHVPVGECVLVVSKGDEALVSLGDRPAWHFPCTPDGSYLGYYPATDDEAVRQLESLRESGACYFVLPKTAFWWLDHYHALRECLQVQHEAVFADPSCVVYALRAPEADRPGTPPGSRLLSEQIRDLVLLLVPDESSLVLFTAPGESVEMARPAARISVRDGGCSRDDFDRAKAMGARFAVLPAQILLDEPPDASLVTHQRHVCTIYELVPNG